MDYYATLGLRRGASDADIKKAYRSLAMKHHPDRGGDEKKFKEISQAYEFLSDPQKKQIIDMGGDPNQQGGFQRQGSPFEFHFGTGNMDDLFGNFGFGFGQRQMRRNKSLNINVEVDLEEVLTGKELNAEITIPGGRKKMVTIEIPAGIEHGQQIKYSGMGDHSIPDLRPGDLIVNIFVRQHHTFKREGESLIYDHIIDAWDAILGTTVDIKTLENKTISITIPPGTQPDTILSCRGEGLPNVRTKQRGNLLIRIKVSIPRKLSPNEIKLVQDLKSGL